MKHAEHAFSLGKWAEKGTIEGQAPQQRPTTALDLSCI